MSGTRAAHLAFWQLHDCLGPGEAVEIFELFQHDLDFLPVWRTLSDEMKTLISPGQSFSTESSPVHQIFTFAFLTSSGVESSNKE